MRGQSLITSTESGREVGCTVPFGNSQASSWSKFWRTFVKFKACATLQTTWKEWGDQSKTELAFCQICAGRSKGALLGTDAVWLTDMLSVPVQLSPRGNDLEHLSHVLRHFRCSARFCKGKEDNFWLVTTAKRKGILKSLQSTEGFVALTISYAE